MSRARLAKADNEVKDIGINLADAYIFLEKLTGEEEAVVTFQTYDDQKKGRVTPQHFSGTLTECQETLTAENQRGAGIFVMVNSGNLNGRSEKNVTGIRAVFLDLDGSPLEPVLEWELEPHLITQTSPGQDGQTRYQCFWRVKDFPLDKELFGAAQTALCKKFNGDPHITKDLCRVMRVPGFFQQKREPFLCSLEDRTTSHLPYAAQEILAALGVDPEKPKKEDLTERREIEQGQVAVREGSRNSYLTSEAGKLRHIGLEFEELLPALTAINSRRCKPPLPDQEVRSIARSISKHQPGKAPKESKAVMPVGISFADLQAKKLHPPAMIVQDVLSEGLAIMAGPPKIRKSWLGLNLAVAVATGGLALSRFACAKGDVLYLGLEDNERRAQERINTMLADGAAPSNAMFFDRWPKLDQKEAGIDLLHKWILDRPDTKLIIVDTFQKIRALHGPGSNAYQTDYADLTELQALASQYRIAIFLIHHTRKTSADDVFDEALGSRGLFGAADTQMILKKANRGDMDAILHIEGRDFKEPKNWALRFGAERCTWECVGTSADYELTKDRQAVRDLLVSSDQSMTAAEIAEALGKKRTAVYWLLGPMERDGLISKLGTKYRIPDEDSGYANHAKERLV